MKLKSKNILIACQMIVILAFFSGLWLNYFLLIPVIDVGETARMTTEIDEYCSRFLRCSFRDFKDSSLVDSLLKFDPYGSGDLIIMDGEADILYSQNKGITNVYEYIDSAYGEKASNLLRLENEFPKGISRMEYDIWNTTSFYANYETVSGLMFFYSIDYTIPGKKLFDSLYYLAMFMLISGSIVILISYFISKMIVKQVHMESQVQQELDTAALIQRSMLPREEKHLIQLDIDAKLVPAKKVGGDFYCYHLRDGLLYFCIGDVSGKSVPASIFMSRAITLFRSYSHTMTTAREIAVNLNNELCTNNPLNMFMTGIIGVLSTYDGKITYVNAGHEAPIIWDGKMSSNLQYLKTEGNIPFGVIKDTEYMEETHEVKKNGLIIFYTDGVTEAKNKRKMLLGHERLLNTLESVKNLTSKEINSHLLRQILDYEKKMEQSDDITILTFRNATNTKTLLIKNKISELRKIAPFTEEIFKECYMNPKYHILIRTGLDEALTNCVKYAYKTPNNDIEVSASIENRHLCFTITDSGIPFNPLEYNPEPSAELKVGGLGIFMYKSNFDDVQYSRKDGHNILKLIKII